jgi:mRNA interferase YafQ
MREIILGTRFGMREIILGTRFKRDVKLVEKRGKNMAKLRELILLLAEETPLPPRYKDHPLGGEWNHHRDAHIEPNWLLLYKIDGNDLYLVRNGSHSDLF